MTDRIDRLVDGLAQKLATHRTGRRQILRAGVVAAGASTGLLATASPASADLDDCFGTRDVQTCYSPWKVVAAELLSDGVKVRRGPSKLAPAVGTVPVGGHVGRQSNRIGRPCGSNPGPRPSVNGWIWVSGRALRPGATSCWQLEYPSAPSGWMPMTEAGRKLAVPDSRWAGSTCGPHSDFDCRRPQQAYTKPCTCYNGCNRGTAGPMARSNVYYTVGAHLLAKKSLSEYYTLRYAADSTPTFWLMPGDVVYRHGYKKIYEPIGPDHDSKDDDGRYHTWSCVSVVCAQYAPAGMGGWIRSVTLTNPSRTRPQCSQGGLRLPLLTT